MTLDQFIKKSNNLEQRDAETGSADPIDRQILTLLQAEPREHFEHFVIARLQAKYGTDVKVIKNHIDSLVWRGRITRSSDKIELSGD